MNPAESMARIQSYLEEHKATYTRDALRRKLLADGHDPTLVDEALAEAYRDDTPVAGAAGNASGWILGSFLVHGLLVAALLGWFIGHATSFGLAASGGSLSVLILLGGPLVLLAEGRLLRWFSSSDSRLQAVAQGALLGAIAFPLIFFGTCAVSGGGNG